MSKSYIDILQDLYINQLIRMKGLVSILIPSDTVIKSSLIRSFQQLTPERQAQIVEQLGPDWYIEMAAKIERQLRALTKEK